MKPIPVIAMLLLAFAGRVLAQSTQPTIGLSVGSEEGKKVIRAVVTLNGKPVENAVLRYSVQRTFGELSIGEDTTLDDGTSAVAFPSDLPGTSDGKLHLTVRIKSPAQFASVSATAACGADCPPAAAAVEFPRALWAPNAPLSLLLCIFVLLAGVWLSYLFVVGRILAIRNGGKL